MMDRPMIIVPPSKLSQVRTLGVVTLLIANPASASDCCQTAEPKKTPDANAAVEATGLALDNPARLGVIARK
jgi:hypothetical protein